MNGLPQNRSKIDQKPEKDCGLPFEKEKALPNVSPTYSLSVRANSRAEDELQIKL